MATLTFNQEKLEGTKIYNLETKEDFLTMMGEMYGFFFPSREEMKAELREEITDELTDKLIGVSPDDCNSIDDVIDFLRSVDSGDYASDIISEAIRAEGCYDYDTVEELVERIKELEECLEEIKETIRNVY